MIEAAILFIQEQVAALLAAYQVLKSLSITSSSTTSTRLAHAWNAAVKKQKRTVRSAYIQFVAFYCLIGSFIFGGAMYAIEENAGTPRSFVDCLFTMASAASSTALIVLDTSILQVGSKALIGFVMFAWANTLLIAAIPMLFRICRLHTARRRCDTAGELLKRRREAFNNLYKEKEQQLHIQQQQQQQTQQEQKEQPSRIEDGNIASTSSTSTTATTATVDVSVEITTSEGASILSDKIDSTTSDKPSSSLAVTENPSTDSSSSSLSKKKTTSRRNSRRDGQIPDASINMANTDVASAADLMSNTTTRSNHPPTSTSSSSSSSSSDSHVDKPVANMTTKLANDLYSFEKKALQTADNAHKEHDALLRSLENGSYLLGHYLLFALIVAYYFLILIIGFIAYVWHFSVDPDAMAVLAKNPATVNVSFFSAFFTIATVTNGGFYLLPDGLIQLGSDRFTIIVTAILATIGFGLHPLGLRIFVLMVHAGSNGRYKAALRDILDNPRRYYTHLYSEKGTWAATLMSISMTGLLFAFFLIFNYPDNYFKTMFPQNDIRAMNGWFESIMVYNNGYNTFDLSMMDVGSQVFMMLCMWATGRPFTLGILVTASESSISSDDADDSDGVDDIDSSSGSVWTVTRELLMLLRSDLIILVICTLMICMYDNALLTSGVFTGPDLSIGTGSYVGVFPIAFDLSSAYGNVGLSLGFPNTVTSTCAVLSPFGKLVVIFMCIHGYCMGIYPSSVSALELPYGVEEANNTIEEEGDNGGLNTSSPEDDAKNDIYLLRKGAMLSDALNRTQILRLCELALHSVLTKASRSSTTALSSTEAKAGAAADDVVSQLSDEGKQALCALILKRRLHTLMTLEDAHSKKNNQDGGKDHQQEDSSDDNTLRSIKRRHRGAALESLFADVAPTTLQHGGTSRRAMGSPGGGGGGGGGGTGVVIGRRGGQGPTPSRRLGGRGT